MRQQDHPQWRARPGGDLRHDGGWEGAVEQGDTPFNQRPRSHPDHRAPERLSLRIGGKSRTVRLKPYGNSALMEIPGTPEFTKRYIPPPEPIIERIVPSKTKAEGFDVVRCDGVSGEPLDG
jgi:hypothetical protein